MHLLILIKKKDFFSVLTMDRTEKKAVGLRPFLRVQAERRRKSDRLCLARIASAARAGGIASFNTASRTEAEISHIRAFKLFLRSGGSGTCTLAKEPHLSLRCTKSYPSRMTCPFLLLSHIWTSTSNVGVLSPDRMRSRVHVRQSFQRYPRLTIFERSNFNLNRTCHAFPSRRTEHS